MTLLCERKEEVSNPSESIVLLVWTSGNLVHFHLGYLLNVVYQALPEDQFQGKEWSFGIFILINVHFD